MALVLIKATTAAPSLPPLTSLDPTYCSGIDSFPQPYPVSGTCSVTSLHAVDPESGLLGVQLSGALQISQPAGPAGIAVPIISGVDDNYPSNTAPYTGTIPVSWDFSATSNNGSNLSWSLVFEFFDENGKPAEIQEGNMADFNLASGATESGTSSITLTDAGVTSYSISLLVDGQPSADSISVTMDSIDVAPPTRTPEPASTLLFSGGLMILAVWHFRRR